MICVLLGASIYFARIFFLLFRIMFCIFYFNKSGNDRVCHAYFTSLHVFFTTKTAGLTPHNILLKESRNHTVFPQGEEKKQEQETKEGYTKEGCTKSNNYSVT